WTGSAFQNAGTPVGYSAITEIDLSSLTGKLECAGQLSLRAPDAEGQIYFELGRMGKPYLFVMMDCSTDPKNRTFVIADRFGETWRALDAVSPNLPDVENWPRADGNKLDLSGATYTWD